MTCPTAVPKSSSAASLSCRRSGRHRPRGPPRSPAACSSATPSPTDRRAFNVVITTSPASSSSARSSRGTLPPPKPSGKTCRSNVHANSSQKLSAINHQSRGDCRRQFAQMNQAASPSVDSFIPMPRRCCSCRPANRVLQSRLFRPGAPAFSSSYTSSAFANSAASGPVARRSTWACLPLSDATRHKPGSCGSSLVRRRSRFGAFSLSGSRCFWCSTGCVESDSRDFAAALLIPMLWTGLEYFRSGLYYLRFSWFNAGYAFSGQFQLAPSPALWAFMASAFF